MALSLTQARVLSLVGELRYCKPHGVTKKKEEYQREKSYDHFNARMEIILYNLITIHDDNQHQSEIEGNMFNLIMDICKNHNNYYT